MKKKIAKKDRIKGDSWTKQQYRDFMLETLRRRASSSVHYKVKIADNFDYYYGHKTNEDYENLLNLNENNFYNDEDNSPSNYSQDRKGNTPYNRINFDSLSPKFNLLLGDLVARGLEINITTDNLAALERKKMHENQLKFLMQMQKTYQEAAEFTGVEYGVNENLPQNQESFKEYIKKYRDIYEILMEYAVQKNIEKYKYEYLRKNLFLDLLVSNSIYCKEEIRNGFTQPRRINPLNGFPDDASEDDYHSDMSDFMEIYYMNIPDCIEKFDLDPERMKEMIKSYRDKTWRGFTGVNSLENQANSLRLLSPFERRYGNDEYYFDRVLVMEGEWLDSEYMSQKVTHDKHGNTHVHTYEGYNDNARLRKKEREDPRNSLKEKKKQTVRKAALIAGDWVVNYGKAEYQPRDYSNPETTRLSYVCVTHNYNNLSSVSLMDRVKDIQDFKNYILTLVQKEITTHIGNVLYIDKSRIDTDTYGKGPEAVQELYGIAKTYKFVIGNASKDQFSNIDRGLPFQNIPAAANTFVMDNLNLAVYLEGQIQMITGINEARQGQGGDRELSSVNANRTNQSNMMTETYFNAMMGFEQRLFECKIKNIAMAWDAHPELYENIAANLGIELPEDFKMDLQSYVCSVTTYPMSRRELRVSAKASLEQGNLDFTGYLEIMMIAGRPGGLKRAMREYIEGQRKREEMMMAQQQQQLMAQQQEAQAKRQFEMQKEIGKIQTKGKVDLEKQRLANENAKRMKMLELGNKEYQEELKLEQIFANNPVENEGSPTGQ